MMVLACQPEHVYSGKSEFRMVGNTLESRSSYVQVGVDPTTARTLMEKGLTVLGVMPLVGSGGKIECQTCAPFGRQILF